MRRYSYFLFISFGLWLGCVNLTPRLNPGRDGSALAKGGTTLVSTEGMGGTLVTALDAFSSSMDATSSYDVHPKIDGGTGTEVETPGMRKEAGASDTSIPDADKELLPPADADKVDVVWVKDANYEVFAVDTGRDLIDTNLPFLPDVPPPDVPGLTGAMLHLPFESSERGIFIDNSGRSNHATMVGPWSLSPGKIGNALVLGTANTPYGGTTNGYAKLPVGMLSKVSDVTIAVWVKLKSNKLWNRVFDFGSGLNQYMLLTPNTQDTKALRFSISNTGNGGEQHLVSETIPVGEWKHLAVVLGPMGGQLYVDGVLVNTNPNMTLRPSSLGSTTNNWIGRSQFTIQEFSDPYFDGQIDDFRIYDRALAGNEIQTLAMK